MPVIGVALSIPEPWASDLQAYRTRIDPSAATIPTHITLVPPTVVDDDGLGVVEDHLTAVAGDVPAFDVHLRGTGTFRPISPVVFISLVEGISQTEQLAAAVRTGPLDVDVDFPFHPHVTVAHHLDAAVMDRAFDDLAEFDAAFAVGGFHLYVHDDAEGWRPTREFPLARASG
ncbi:MAG: 2'-5' RNA ligase family protein [Nocardioides sp.]